MAAVAGYLYSAPWEKHLMLFGIVYADHLPVWWSERHAKSVRIAPLTLEQMKAPLLDIVKGHAHELGWGG